MAIATLPIVLAVVLTELAVGGAFLLWFIDRGGRAPSGFLKLVAFVDACAMAAALLLGHWYLVTPKLSPGPLRRAALVVVFAVAVQLLLVAIVALRGDFTGTWETALSVALGLRIGVGLLMTLLVALAAWWTAGMNTQSSTGLLYVAL